MILTQNLLDLANNLAETKKLIDNLMNKYDEALKELARQ